MKLSLARVIQGAALLLSLSSPAIAQEAQIPKTVPEMWNAWCSRCHGKDGTGKVAEPTVTVRPMDFTNCKLATSEGDPDWEAVISKGGPVVGLSSQMPAFGDFLTAAQVSEFVGFVKKFCTEAWLAVGQPQPATPDVRGKSLPRGRVHPGPRASHRQDEP
jgi:mono/diheme cytochrome c family protein